MALGKLLASIIAGSKKRDKIEATSVERLVKRDKPKQR